MDHGMQARECMCLRCNFVLLQHPIHPHALAHAGTWAPTATAGRGHVRAAACKACAGKPIIMHPPPGAAAPLSDWGRPVSHPQVAVALLNRMVRMGMPKEQVAELFAKQLHNRWGVGHPACNNGVLLLLSVEDRQVCPTVLLLTHTPALCTLTGPPMHMHIHF